MPLSNDSFGLHIIYIALISMAAIFIFRWLRKIPSNTKLQSDSERLHKIANQLPNLVFQFCMRADGSFYVPYASEVLNKMYRVRPEDVIDNMSALFAMIHPDDLAHHIETMQTSARELTPWHDEYRLKFADGTESWLFGTALPEREDDGLTLWHGFVMDITERKQKEMELINAKNHLQATLDTIPDLMFEVGLDGHYYNVHTAHPDLLMAPPDQLIGKKVSDFLPPDASNITLSALQESLETSHSNGKQFKLPLPQGELWFELSVATKINNSPAHQPRFIVLSRDITERKHNEEKLQKFFDIIPNLLCILSPDGRFVSVNRAWQNILGYDSEELLTFPLIKFIHPEDYYATAHEISKLFLKTEILNFSNRYRHKNGRYHWLEWQAVASNNHEFIFASARDVTNNKLIESELKRSNAELEQFAYAVSHDMRQPLRMVTSYLSLIEKALAETLDDETRQFLTFATDGAKRMDAMILSLLDYSRVARLTEPFSNISTRAALDEALLFLKPALKTSGGNIHASGNWIDLIASRDELTRLFQNLIDNALKYHDENNPPQVEILASVKTNIFRVEVRDSGIGIEPSQMERLFKVFSRLQARSRFEGTGVGLALCRKIMEHHGGKIGVESEGEGLGCVFWVEFPITNNKHAHS
ncbi:MAG: PAS domain S-box protein [Methylococcaceae bacterium]